ncbi:MAG: single-stranded DNA-binding protein [Clostridia bacterium]|nr:single-stranded DNA-binding protein [Clostridia bacterium]
MNINKVMLMGRLTADPELKMSASGVPNVRFSVAVNRRFARQGEDRPTADFIRCTAFRQTAEFVSKYFRKGSVIIVFGSLQNDNYKDRDGNDRQSTTVIVDEVQFGETKQDRSQQRDQDDFSQPQPASHADNTAAAPSSDPGAGVNSEFFADIKDIEDELPF